MAGFAGAPAMQPVTMVTSQTSTALMSSNCLSPQSLLSSPAMKCWVLSRVSGTLAT
jgi:hypothetical protein